MKIINPIYDRAFKYLMDNERIAKIVMSIILNTKVISLQSKPQETAVVVNQHTTLPRYDFKAIIQTETGENKAVLIELQKYKNPDPIIRFRDYIANNYKKEETIISTQRREVTESLPLIAVYILGYKVTKANVLGIVVERTLKDIITGEPIDEMPKFIDLLNHQTIVLQTSVKPTKNANTRLERFIRLFSQKLEGESPNYFIEIEENLKVEPELIEIVDYLNKATLNENIIRSLKYEAQHEEGLKAYETELKNAIEKELQAIQIAKEERRQKEEERRQKEEERRQKEEIQQKLIKSILNLYKKGFSADEIAEDFGISISEVEKIIKNQ